MLLITAPSKTQQPLVRQFATYSLPTFIQQSCELNNILQKFSLTELCKLMHMSEKLGETTRQRIRDFLPPLTRENSSQAIFTFQGDAYSRLTPDSYSEGQLLHAQKHLRILSGLYGILRPLDLMFPYRLEMGTRLQTLKGENLYTFWGDAITDQLNDNCHEDGHQHIINLASHEYAKIINVKKLTPRFITISFQEQKGDDYKTIPIHSKRARGMMIHYVISKQLTNVEQLLDFSVADYTFAKEPSTADHWIYRRG